MLQAEIQYFCLGAFSSERVNIHQLHCLHCHQSPCFEQKLPASLALPQPCHQGEEHEVPLHTRLGCSAVQWLMLHLSVSRYLVRPWWEWELHFHWLVVVCLACDVGAFISSLQLSTCPQLC